MQDEQARQDALELHQCNTRDKENAALYDLRKMIFFEVIDFQKRIEEKCLAAGFSVENAAIDIHRVDDEGDRYGFILTVESGVLPEFTQKESPS